MNGLRPPSHPGASRRAGRNVGKISGLKRCHGVAVVPELGKGYITDGDAASVVVFDTKSLKKTGEIKSYPDTAIVHDPASKLI
jgi:DNA-binding beta-propeller fold protein YncE